MGKWSPAQRRYAQSIKGREARRRYQQSEKGKAARKAYLARRKTRLSEMKLKQTEEAKPVAKEAKVDKIRKETASKN